MKYLAWIGGIVASVVGVVYVLAFTSLGNSIVQPIIEEKIIHFTKLESKLSTFSLNMSSFEIVVEVDKDNIMYINGNYSLFSQTFNVAYRINMDKLQTLKALTNAPIQGVFHTDGTVKGNPAFITVDGKSDVARGNTTYHVELTEFNPTSIIAKVKEADLASLLYLGGQKAYANAEVNLDVNFKNITPHAMDGTVLLQTNKGKLDAALMLKEFAVNIPRTDFSMKLDAKLKGNDVDYTYILSSNLANIATSGNVVPTPLKTDIKYSVDIQELAVLKPITGADVRGSFTLKGNVKGSKEELIVDGKSDVAYSETSFTATLKDFAPDKVTLNIKNLKLERLLYMVKQPSYATGTFNLDVDISDAKTGKLKGEVVSSIKDGLLNSPYMTKAYEFTTPMPYTAFNLQTRTKLNGNLVDTKVNLESSLADFDIKQAKFNIKDGSLVSDYLATIPNLDKLFFATEQHMKGSIAVNGELKKAKDLDLTIRSKVVGGNIEAKLHNDDFHADIKAIQTLEALHMLIYPEIFKASLDAKVDYNLVQQKGKMVGKLVDGKFTQNQVLSLIKQYAGVDLYVETFKGDVSADINKENIVASLDLKSNTSAIKTKKTKLNSKTKQIDSKITIVANKSPVAVTLKGNVSSPKVAVDLEKFMKSKAGEAIQKEAVKFLKGFL